MTANKRAFERNFAPRSMKMAIPPSKGRCERIEETPETCPPPTRGDFRGVTGNPHQVLIQQGLPPSSPPLAKGGRVREQRASPRTHEFFHTFRGAGVSCPEPENPTGVIHGARRHHQE